MRNDKLHILGRDGGNEGDDFKRQLVEQGVLCPIGGQPHAWLVGWRESGTKAISNPDNPQMSTGVRVEIIVFYCSNCRRLDVQVIPVTEFYPKGVSPNP